jgi:hypothetical protein
MNSNNSTLTAALKKILNATKLSEIADALKDVSQEPTAAFKDLQQKIRMRIGIKVFMTLIGLGIISWIIYMAYLGGVIVFGEGMGKLVLIFGTVDTIILLILALELIPGKKGLWLIPLEIGSLIFLGYVMVGYFGSGNLKTATDSKLMKDYEVVNHYYSEAKSDVSKATKTAMDAVSVAAAEKALATCWVISSWLMPHRRARSSSE